MLLSVCVKVINKLDSNRVACGCTVCADTAAGTAGPTVSVGGAGTADTADRTVVGLAVGCSDLHSNMVLRIMDFKESIWADFNTKEQDLTKYIMPNNKVELKPWKQQQENEENDGLNQEKCGFMI